jgi:hypothetical protein
MDKPFEVFRVCSDDEPLWLESATSLGLAQLRVEELGTWNPGEYLIYCPESGEQLSISARGRGAENGHCGENCAFLVGNSDRDTTNLAEVGIQPDRLTGLVTRRKST